MALFTSTYVNKVDRKGRVSVPAGFRAALDAAGAGLVYVKPNHGLGAVDGLSEAWMEQIQTRIDELDIYSEERVALETREFAETTRLPLDPEGRMILPKELMATAGITDQATFVGLGRYFQVWEPARFEEHKKRQVAAAETLTLPKPGGRVGGGT
ncbi:MAG: division/cell wall cluster transcriptional repressor MraZ [Inquilinus sp.]|nr:division/cell wall cluster transcriptional repressor MraZ [Inquilinus sp.]